MSAPRAAAIGLAAALAAGVPAAEEPEKPKEVGLLERASTRLAQLDVTVSGPKDAIRSLSVADFEVRLNDKLVSGLIVDALCAPAAPPAPEPGVQAVAPAPPPRGPSASYLLYFDMPHLTQSGRRGAIDAARAMLPKLLAGGNRAMLVANAADLKILVRLTDDPKTLDLALERMIHDSTLFDTYAATEEKRIAELTNEMSLNVDSAALMASRYASEERYRQERDLRRLTMVLGRFADVDPPKAALYFADTMRQNAGEHYLAYFGGSVVKNSNGVPEPGASQVRQDAATGSLPLDRVMNEASSLGIRIYAVEGQGIATYDSILTGASSTRLGVNGNDNPAWTKAVKATGMPMVVGNIETSNTTPADYARGQRDAQETLNSLAAETGGRSFLNGVSPAKMASQINDDMSCVYLLSFDPKGYPQDKPLAVSVAVKRPKVKAAVRGRLVIQSDESRLAARVLSAFVTTAETPGATSALRAGIVPVSYADGHFKARVQVAVPGSAVPDATWDFGASLVTRDDVWEDGAGHVQVKQPGVPVAFERDMEFAPGDFELVAVAHEVTTDTLLTQRTAGRFPDLDADRASVAPIAVSQQARGGFLRDGKSLAQGALVVPEGEPLQPGVPTAIIALVCRAKGQKGRLTIARTLSGETETPVGTTDLELEKDERCGQIVDLIPARFLGPGSYRFTITVSAQGAELARSERALVVPEPQGGGR